VIVLAIGWVLAVQAGMLERLGLRESPARTLLSGAPDLETAEALETELWRSNVNLQGISVYVFPMEGTGGKLAIVTAEYLDGYRVGQSGEPREVLGGLKDLATGDTLNQLGITRLAVDFRGKRDSTVLALTAETEDIQAFANGRMERKEFLKRVDGKVNPVAAAGRLGELLP
jgi:hypothetical protein